jgi:RNA polymerase sigma-70 factor (ECF subfamily)
VVTTHPTDADLLPLARRGDVPAIGLLLESHRPALTAHALGILGHRRADEIEDVVQETFLQVLTKLGQLREPDAFRAWLHAILRNACFQYLRRERTAPAEQLDPERLDNPTWEDFRGPRDEVQEQVWAAIDELPTGLQAALILRHFSARRSYDEIAAILGVPIGTVRSRLHEARRKLAATLRSAAERDSGDLLARLEAEAAEFGSLLAAAYAQGRGEWYELLAEDVIIRFPGQQPVRGRSHIQRDFAGDIDAGVRLEVDEVLVSSTVCVATARLISPPEDPFHCPPAATMLTLREDGTHVRLHMYHAARTGTPGAA